MSISGSHGWLRLAARVSRLAALSVGLLLSFVLLFLLSLSPPLAQAQRYAEFLPDEFVLFWPNPVRAHPGVPIRFRFSAYEINNQPLTWQLTAAPQGMSIDQDGRVSWTPTNSQVGSHSVSVKVSRPDGVFRERTFTTRVNTSEFYFVAPNGSDSNPGTLAQPFRTIGKAMFSVSSGNGKTIYIRGGTYTETWNWEIGDTVSPFRAKTFTPESPVEVVGYPGETAILDCQFLGHGFWFFRTAYGVLDNVKIIRARGSERGGIIVSQSENIVIRDTTVQGAQWSYTENCTGYNIASPKTVLDGALGFDNRDPNSSHWNSSNFLFYLTQPSTTNDPIYVISSKAAGSVTGFKIKHAGPNRLIIHKSEAFDNDMGYVIGSTGSSIRYSVSVRNTTGIHLGVADPNPYSDGAMLVDHNTVVNSSGTGLNLQDGYSIPSPSSISNNIFVNTLRSAGGGEFDGRLMQFWIYDASAVTRAIKSENNLFFAPSQANIIRLGNSDYKATSFSQWQSLGHDGQSLFSDPQFSDVNGFNFSLAPGSPALRADGTFAGAFRPGILQPITGVRPSNQPPAAPVGVRAQQIN